MPEFFGLAVMIKERAQGPEGGIDEEIRADLSLPHSSVFRQQEQLECPLPNVDMKEGMR